MKYPKYVKTFDGYIGVFAWLDAGEVPVYYFKDGGYRLADDWELKHGSDHRETLEPRGRKKTRR